MRYSAFRARGLCVATGIVEAGCKHAVGARLKRAGMRSVNGANAILALRCCILTDAKPSDETPPHETAPHKSDVHPADAAYRRRPRGSSTSVEASAFL